MKQLKKINDALKKAELWFGTASMIFIFLLITLNIVKRYFFNNAWGWAGELNGFLYAWIAFISAAYTMADDRHVRISLVDEKIGVRASHMIRIGTDVITIVAFVWLCFPTLNAIKAMKLTSALRWPKGAVYSGLLVGYVLYIFHSVIQIFRRVHLLKTGEDLFAEDAEDTQQPQQLITEGQNEGGIEQ
ncbi:MAG: TRAP transporter small permease [Eubacteriales bacterium]|nr:TRAP transporter small permease [Eubacteriales bacterium]